MLWKYILDNFTEYFTFDITMSSKYFHKKNKIRKVKNLIEIECYEYKNIRKIEIKNIYNVMDLKK